MLKSKSQNYNQPPKKNFIMRTSGVRKINMKKSFTIIELLVVITIIGLLVSVVLVSTVGIREKAKITKTLEFSQSLQRNLGAYAVGIWSLDDQTNPTKDGSGYNNHGTVNGAVFTSETPHLAAGVGTGKYALSFDGVNDYVDAGNGASLNITSIITIEAWVNLPNGNVINYGGIVGKLGSNAGYALEWQDVLYFVTGDGTTVSWDSLYSGGSDKFGVATPGAWTHVAVTWDGATKRFYRDGVLKGTVARTGFASNNVKVGIGSRTGAGGGVWFNGLIDEVHIYERALTLGEIQKHYAEGLKEHHVLAIDLSIK